MGMIDTTFGVFCEGLSHNNKLQVLDLRNNQITHTGATELAAALKRNTMLRALGILYCILYCILYSILYCNTCIC